MHGILLTRHCQVEVISILKENPKEEEQPDRRAGYLVAIAHHRNHEKNRKVHHRQPCTRVTKFTGVGIGYGCRFVTKSLPFLQYMIKAQSNKKNISPSCPNVLKGMVQALQGPCK